MKQYIIIPLLVAAFAGGLFLGWDLRDGKATKEALEARNNAWNLLIGEQQKYTAAIEKKDAQALALEAELTRQRNARPATRIVEKEIEKVIYRECRLPDSGVQLYNSAIRAGVPEGDAAR